MTPNLRSLAVNECKYFSAASKFKNKYLHSTCTYARMHLNRFVPIHHFQQITHLMRSLYIYLMLAALIEKNTVTGLKEHFTALGKLFVNFLHFLILIIYLDAVEKIFLVEYSL